MSRQESRSNVAEQRYENKPSTRPPTPFGKLSTLSGCREDTTRSERPAVELEVAQAGSEGPPLSDVYNPF